MSEIKKIQCPYDCPATCGILAEIEDGKIIRVKNDPSDRVSKNGLCRKMQHYERDIYSPDRILTPLRRVGKKGEGKFERISWDEAVTEITDKFKEIIKNYGSEAIFSSMYSGVMSDIQRHCGDAFLNRIGASVLVKTLCASAKGEGYASVVGSTGCLDPEEINDSDYYIIWGSNMAATRLQTLADMQKPENRHKKKVLIDTFPNPTIKYCDEFIPIKAGTDGALALAMMHILKRDGFVDKAFMEQYTCGYDVFAQTLDKYTPEWAEKETGISVDIIEKLASEYAHAKAPVIILGSGNSRYGNGGMTVRLIVILSALTGAWAKVGGGLCGCTPISDKYVNKALIVREDFRKKPARKLNINQTGQALALTGDEAVRAFYVYGCNPANTVSNQQAVIKGLMREDLFTVVHERFMTDTARYADIILPATFSPEQSDIYRAYGYCTMNSSMKVVDAPGECKSNWDTFALLAKGMGFEEDYFKQTEEEMVQFMLAHPTEAIASRPASDLKILKEGGSINMPFSNHLDFKTRTGKMMIVDETLNEPIPRYMKHYGGSYPLNLVASPSVYSLNSTFLNREELMKNRREISLWMNSEDAKDRGIKDGQHVIAYNELGEVEFVAKVSNQVGKGNVVSEGVYRMDQSLNGCSFNTLTHERLSDIGEATTMNDNTVEVRPI